MRIALVVWLLCTPIGNGITHSLVNRLFRKKNWPAQKLALMSIGISLFVFLSVTLIFSPLSLSLVAFSFVVATGLSHVYFHLFNMSETARRIKILVQIQKGDFTRQRAQQSYLPQELVRVRLKRLLDLRQIEKRGDRFFARRSLLSFAAYLTHATEACLFPERF